MSLLLGPNLDAFLAVVDCKTVQSASRQLGITQTGVTQRIRSLEGRLSTTLFVRSRRGMQLSSEGEALLRYCQNARDLEGEALAKIRSPGVSSSVRVTLWGPTSLMRNRLIPQALPVIKRFPQLSVSFDISDASNGADILREGRAQFVVVARELVSREMESKILRPEEYVLVASKNWAHREVRDIVSRERAIDFNEADLMTHAYLKKYKLLSLVRSERHFVNNNESLLEMLHEGLGYGVLTREFASLFGPRNGIAVLNDGRALENRLALAWFPRPNPAGYFKALIEALN